MIELFIKLVSKCSTAAPGCAKSVDTAVGGCATAGNNHTLPAVAGRRLFVLFCLFAICLFSGADWLQFRGDDNTNVSQEKNLPKAFDVAKGEHVAWKADLPGVGPSGPIAVGGRIIVTAAGGPRQDQLHVLCFDARSGKPLWRRQFWATGSTVCDPFGGVAAPTPASDGQSIFAFYSSNDLACFDLEGNLKWLRGLGFENPKTRNDAGMASSPLVTGSTVIVQLENQGDSFAAGIDKATGETRWRIERDRGAIWSSPVVLRGKTREDDFVLLHSRSKLTAHDPLTGKVAWEYAAYCHTVASSTTSGDCIYLPAIGLHALKYDPAARSVSLLWNEDRLRSDNCSPVVHGGRAYVVKPPGNLMCADTAVGKTLWQLRLQGPIWATPLLADGCLYCVNEDGLVQVVQLGEEGKLLGTFPMGEKILASPIVSDGAIYFRGNAHLWKIAP
jgi:outer membrane protein assembly factor BamB